jgi:hypothetical protein
VILWVLINLTPIIEMGIRDFIPTNHELEENPLGKRDYIVGVTAILVATLSLAVILNKFSKVAFAQEVLLEEKMEEVITEDIGDDSATRLLESFMEAEKPKITNFPIDPINIHGELVSGTDWNNFE